MKNLKYFLLSFLIILSFSEYGSAQMPFTVSNPSYGREISNTVSNRVMPIKTVNWNNSHIISLVHYESNKLTNGRFLSQGSFSYQKDSCSASIFYLTELGSTVIKTVRINETVTDFCIVDDIIYMCGQNSANINFIIYENINVFFNSLNPSNIHYLNNGLAGRTLTNIDFCISQGQPTLLLLANNTQNDGIFISYRVQSNNISNSYSLYFASNDTCRLLDVVHTNNYIAVLGMKNDTTFTLVRHDINNISNIVGKKFFTNPLCYHFVDPKYHLATLRKDLNHVVVGESVMNTGWMEFNIIDLNTMQILYTQATTDEREGRSKIMDLEFDEQRSILYCLFCNGLDIRDMILQVLPYNTQNIYSAQMSLPNMYRTGYSFLKDITLYGGNSQFLILGRTTGLNVYFFDRIFNFNILGNCDLMGNLYIRIVLKPTESTFNYYQSISYYTQPALILLTKYTSNHKVICQ